MSEIQDGYYDASIIEAWTELQRPDSKELMVCFGVDIDLPDGQKQDAVARHFTEGEYSGITKEIFKHLELSWPAALKDLTPCAGKPVRVRVKHKEQDGQTYINVYIVTSRPRQPATEAQVEAALARIEAKEGTDDDSLPF